MAAKMDWEHVDLFFYRETNQNKCKDLVYPESRLSDFGKAQIEIAKALVEDLSPQIIVVANAMASEIFEQEFDAQYDNRLGHHFTELSSRNVPVFLGSMLTGQRAMDRYSFQRLQWQVARAAANLLRSSAQS